MLRPISTFSAISLLFLGTLPGRVLADQILKTSGFSTCLDGSNITVQNLDIEYNNDDKTVTFNVAGSSTSVQNVTAQLNVTAYGISVYQNSFNPCNSSTYVEQLCPGKYPYRHICTFGEHILTFLQYPQVHSQPAEHNPFQLHMPPRFRRLHSQYPTSQPRPH